MTSQQYTTVVFAYLTKF